MHHKPILRAKHQIYRMSIGQRSHLYLMGFDELAQRYAKDVSCNRVAKGAVPGLHPEYARLVIALSGKSLQRDGRSSQA